VNHLFVAIDGDASIFSSILKIKVLSHLCWRWRKGG
jgi:hypothetical protein